MKTLSALIEMLVRWNGFLRKKWNWNDEQPFTAWSIKVNPVHRVFIEVWYGSVPYVTVDGESVEWAVHLALRVLSASIREEGVKMDRMGMEYSKEEVRGLLREVAALSAGMTKAKGQNPKE